MIRQISSRCGLLALALAVGLALAPATAPAHGRSLQARRQARIEPRRPDSDLLSILWTVLTSLWAKDGAHLDPYG